LARQRALLTAVALLLPFTVGTALRLWNLPSQILGGDEVHAIRAALNLPLSKILVTYQESDNCIPLTAVYKLLMGWGVPVTEVVLRLPVLLCGLAALLALPAAVSGGAGRVSPGTVGVYRWLLALSPALVFYSRIARSYMPMVLFSFGAVMAFEAWWRTRSWRSGGVYVLLGALAVWFHLGAGPIVAAPFLFAAGDALARREDLRRDLRDLILLGLSLAAAFALFLVPARDSLLGVIASKRVEQSVPWSEVLPDVLRLQAGTASGWLAAVFWLAVLAGFVLMFRKDRRFALFTLAVAGGHVAGLLILSPLGMASPVILGRYLLPILPFVLLWASAALAAVPLGPLGAGGLVIPLIAWGPLADPAARRTSFLHHNDFVGFYRPYRTVPAGEIPAFYHRLKGETVLEFPWIYVWESNRTFYVYQQSHGGRVIVSTPQRVFFRPPLALRNVVAPEQRDFCRSGARYAIIHRNVAREEDRIAPGGRISEFEASQPLRRLLRESAAGLAQGLKRDWGKPVYADKLLWVWDLSAVCGGGTQSTAPAASPSAATASPRTKLPGR
jgi:hypothetical protein